jgi:hypothetical protein
MRCSTGKFFGNVQKCWHLLLSSRRQCRSPKGDISEKIPPKLRSGLISEGLRPLTNRRMSRSHLGNLSQSLKDQTTGKEQNRYHLEEIGIAGESTTRLKLAGSKDCANTFQRY